MSIGSGDRVLERAAGEKSPPRVLVPAGGPGGSGDGPKREPSGWPDELFDEPEGNPDKSRVLTFFLLIVVLMTFGGLIGAYIVISTNNVLEWQPFALPVPLWVSTVLIVASSFTYHAGKKAVDGGRAGDTRKYLVATTVLGGMFVASQMLAWLALSNRGLYVYGNPYAGFFYVLTAVHAIHVLGGIAALGAITLRAWEGTDNADERTYRRNLARSVGWYWHFMGLLWVAIFILLGFWK